METEALLVPQPIILDTEPLIERKRDRITSEIQYILKTSIPIVLSALIQSGIFITNGINVSHLGADKIAALGLSLIVIMLTGISPLTGVMTALDTLCSQAYTGARNPHQLGVYLQRALAILFVLYIPIFLIWWNSYYILTVVLKQEPVLAMESAIITRWFCFSVPLILVSDCLRRFLQAQGIMYSGLLVSSLVVPIHILISRIFLQYSHHDIHAVLAATLVSFILNTALMIGFIKYIGGSNCWGGFTKEAFRNWSPMIKIGFSGVLMTFGEIIPLDFIGFYCSYFGSSILGAQTIISNLNMPLYFVYLGFSLSCSVRIGNLLGSKRGKQAKLVTQIAIMFSLIIGAYFAIILWFNRHRVFAFYSNDDHLKSIVFQLFPILCVGQIFHSLGVMTGGILRGIGRQSVGALFKFSAFYCVSIPLGFSLAYFAGLGLNGLWIGLIMSWVYSSLGELTYILHTDWSLEVDKCLSRVEI